MFSEQRASKNDDIIIDKKSSKCGEVKILLNNSSK